MFDVVQNYIGKLLTLLSSCHISFDANLHRNLPKTGGVYRIFEISSDWKESIYVGKTGNLRDRIYVNLLMGDAQAHTLKRKLIAVYQNEGSAKNYLKDNCRVQYLEIDDKKERGLFEHFAISILKSKYND